MRVTLYHERLPATPEAVRRARKNVVDALTEIGVHDADLLSDVALTISEAVGNAVRHANPPGDHVGEVEVTLAETGEYVVVTVQDSGVGMHGENGSHSLGLGLSIMRSQTERLDVTSNRTGTALHLHFDAHEQAAGMGQGRPRVKLSTMGGPLVRRAWRAVGLSLRPGPTSSILRPNSLLNRPSHHCQPLWVPPAWSAAPGTESGIAPQACPHAPAERKPHGCECSQPAPNREAL